MYKSNVKVDRNSVGYLRNKFNVSYRPGKIYVAFPAIGRSVLHVQIVHIKLPTNTRGSALHMMQVVHTSTNWEILYDFMENLNTKISRELTMRKPKKDTLAAAGKSSTEGPFIGRFIWKHLLLLWGESAAFSSFGYARVTPYFCSYFTIPNVATCLTILNVRYTVSDESKDKCDRLFETVVIWHKIVKPIATGWHKKYTHTHTHTHTHTRN